MGEKRVQTYDGVDYQLEKNEVLAIKVALPKAQRTGKFRFKDFGRVEVHSSHLYLDTDKVKKKRKQGHWGWMLVEDYEKKNFGPYGLTEVAKNMDAQSKAISLQKENSSLQDQNLEKDSKIAELQAKLAELEGKTKADKEGGKNPEPKPEKETKVKPEETEKNISSVFDHYLHDLGIPVLAGLPAGHIRRNLALPLNALVEVDAYQQLVRVRERTVR